MTTAGQLVLVPPIWNPARTFTWATKAVVSTATRQIDWRSWLLEAGLTFSNTAPLIYADQNLSIELGDWADGLINLEVGGGLSGTSPQLQIIVSLSDGSTQTITILQPISGTSTTSEPIAQNAGYLLLEQGQSIDQLPLVGAGAGGLNVVRIEAQSGSYSLAVTPASSGGSVSAPLPFYQTVPSTTWVIVHDLGRYPSVLTVDSSGNEVIGSVHYDSINQVTVTFSAPISGSASLS